MLHTGGCGYTWVHNFVLSTNKAQFLNLKLYRVVLKAYVDMHLGKEGHVETTGFCITIMFLVIQSLVEHGVTVDATDHHGNTAMHILCGDRSNAESAKDCISILVRKYCNNINVDINHFCLQVENGARLDVQNNEVRKLLSFEFYV